MFSFKIREGKVRMFFTQWLGGGGGDTQHTALYMHMVINTNCSHSVLRHRYLSPDVQMQERTAEHAGCFRLLVLSH